MVTLAYWSSSHVGKERQHSAGAAASTGRAAGKFRSGGHTCGIVTDSANH